MNNTPLRLCADCRPGECRYPDCNMGRQIVSSMAHRVTFRPETNPYRVIADLSRVA